MIKKLLPFILALTTALQTLEANAQTSDSLTFVREKSGEKVFVTEGMIVEIQTTDKQKVAGEFIGATESKLQIKQNKKVQDINFSELKKITAYNEGSKDPITGSVRFVVSASSATSMILGAGALAGGITTVADNKALGVGLIGISIPLIYYGIKWHLMLKNADRDVIKLNKGWQLQTD